MAPTRPEDPPTSLPTGDVTFLFSDIEGSTRLVDALGDAFTSVLERHQALLREAFDAVGGVEVATEGDSFFVVFRRATDAVAGAAAAQRSISTEPWPQAVSALRVRMGLHTGHGTLGGDNYAGIEVHRAARISAAAHGGQVLISTATRGLVEGSLPKGIQLRDLGAFRLKDLDKPERLIQLVIEGLDDHFPAPRTLDTPSNLPAQVTSFIGRAKEVGEIGELAGRSRLVTLTGPGGTGKTRLSLRVAEELGTRHPDGVFFVELAPIRDPSLLPTTIAQAIGLAEAPGRPVVESLEDHLRDLRILLVLDNFEQVLDGAPLVGRLLQAAPNLTVIATSREGLRLRGEQEYPVPPLALPDPTAMPSLGAFAENEAVALFVQRARAVRPDFEVTNENAAAVAAVCVALDGLPLAIELAAARSKLFTPDALLARLEKRLLLLTSTSRDLTDRQRTLRGAIDWSHDLLDGTERTLFRRLSIFVGGCTIESATAICDADGDLGVDIGDALSSFVDKSLLRVMDAQHGEPRFAMLETIREYGLEKLAASDDAGPIRRRHQDHFAGLALQAEPELIAAHQKEWLDGLDAEQDNVRSALQSAASDGRIDVALEAAGAIWRFWQQRGRLAEGRETLEALLGLSIAKAPTAARAKALSALGGVDYWRGDMPAAARTYAEALDIERHLDDPSALAEALYNAGFVAVLGGERETARANYAEAISIYERLGDANGLTRVREALVFLMYHQGEYESARTLQEDNLAAFRQVGEPYRIAAALSLLSGITLRAGRLDESRAHLSEAVGILQAASDVHSIFRITVIAAAVAVAQGDLERAARLSGAGDTLRAPLGDIATPLQMLGLEDPVPAARAGLGEATFDAAFAAGRAMSLDETVELVRA
ncbi:MAG: hypothetical protein QOJ75_839 [Chloroflexota bacterium]|nr:hypothetical protein [Chloroflexota bacterium]